MANFNCSAKWPDWGTPHVHAESVRSLGRLAEICNQLQEQKDVLQAEVKMLREDLHRVLLTLTERTQRAVKLQAKHETLCSKTIGVEGIDEARSEVQLISFIYSSHRW